MHQLDQVMMLALTGAQFSSFNAHVMVMLPEHEQSLLKPSIITEFQSELVQ